MVNSNKPKLPGDTSYIVRLYRSSPHSHASLSGSKSYSLAGIVERTDNGQRAGFRTIEELWNILAGSVPFADPGLISKQENEDY